MTVQINDILRVVLEYALPNSSQVLNVFTFLVDDFSGNNGDCVQDFVDFFTDEWAPHWDLIGSADADMIGVAVDVLNPDGTVSENVGSATLAIPGTVGGQISGSGIAGYLKANTNTPKTRGSKYVPGMTENHLENSRWNATALAELTALLTAYMTTYDNPNTNNSYQPGVLSRTAVDFVAFNGTGDITDKEAYQRRRKGGSGS